MAPVFSPCPLRELDVLVERIAGQGAEDKGLRGNALHGCMGPWCQAKGLHHIKACSIKKKYSQDASGRSFPNVIK